VDAEETLSAKELAIWLFQRLEPELGVQNVPLAFRTGQRVRWWPLQTAAQHLVGRHPALRSVFREVDGVPRRSVLDPDVPVELETHSTDDDHLTDDLTAFARRPFDLTTELPVRFGHFVGATSGEVVCFVVQHIVFDAVSGSILAGELLELYRSLAGPGDVPQHLTDEVPRHVEPTPAERSLRYWHAHLDGATSRRLNLAPPTSPPPSPFAGARIVTQLSPAAVRAVRELCGTLGVTENIVLLAAYNLLLSRHGLGEDVVVGLPLDTRGRRHRSTIGLHINTVALRTRVDPRATFAELVQSTRDVLLHGMLNADASIDDVAPGSYDSTDDWWIALFRHMFNYRPSEMGTLVADEEFIEVSTGCTRLDLELVVTPRADEITLKAVYATATHDGELVAALLSRYDTLLQNVDPDLAVADIPMWTSHDTAVLAHANNTAVQPSWPTVLTAILDHARSRPHEPALVLDDSTMDYQTLVGAAARLAEALAAHRGDVIGLLADRGPAFAVGALACWLAGCAYLPLDGAHPVARLAHQLDDAGATAILTDQDVPDELRGTRPILPITYGPPGSPPTEVTIDPEAVAYVVYTSGSTGQPKGVEIPHRALANVVDHFARLLDVRPDHAVVWATAPTFDISALEWLLPLVRGGRAVVAPELALAQPEVLLALVEKHDVAVVQSTPSTWRLAVDGDASALHGRSVLCGGEPMTADLARRLRATGCRLYNVYGPSETTIWSLIAEVDTDLVTIGRPIANTRVFVRDAAGLELPPGQRGELCVSGSGVALGYRDRPDLTEARFGTHAQWGRYYRTGDMARWRLDGTLEFLGRVDRQIQLRGHRIELAEVEAVLRRHPQVREAVVVLNGDGVLVAFVECSADVPVADLWAHARRYLPIYSVPSAFRLLNTLPVNNSGKTDHQVLARMVDTHTVPVAGGPWVDKLLPLWRELLNQPTLSEHDNFFLNGGTSLRAASLLTRLYAVADVRVTLKELFAAPTPVELAAVLKER
jgi:amino acid adenylation domain-containing protein